MQNDKYSVDGRKLKIRLSNRSKFSDWIKRNIEHNKLIKNKDFIVTKQEIELATHKKEKINYFLTIEAARKIIFSYPNNKKAKKITEELKNGISLEKVLYDIYESEIKIIKISDEEYPEQLSKIKDPPKQLYVKGNIKNLKELGVAVIGTRGCSNYGRQICRSFTKGLVAYDLNIISGLAKGIDSCAHRACLEVKGKTIAVLPSGINNVFPKQNEELLNKIIDKGGTVISEYPPDFEKTSDSCRERNRIISGLSIGTLVIEAKKRTGTSITVDYTNEQGKKAFCIPSSLLNSKGVGSNEMIKEGRAKIVTEVEDIIKEYPELKLEKRSDFAFDNLRKEKSKKKKTQIIIDEENLEIYNLLMKEPKHIDEISKLTNIPINEITYKLTMLELQGVIKELPGKKFKIIN